MILAEQYYKDGADEITFLNITSFRNSPLKDQPMLDVLRAASERVFVPLTIGCAYQPLLLALLNCGFCSSLLYVPPPANAILSSLNTAITPPLCFRLQRWHSVV